MSKREALRRRVIAVSTSESADMPALGLSDEHLRDAMAEIARHMLRTGSRLVYGGDLRHHGFSKLLFEIVARHQPVGDDVEEHVGVTIIWRAQCIFRCLSKGLKRPLERLPGRPSSSAWT